MDKKEVRDYIVDALKKLGTIATVELNGFNFLGVDITIKTKTDDVLVYRFTIIEHKLQKMLM